jgi:hypothetical protein
MARRRFTAWGLECLLLAAILSGVLVGCGTTAKQIQMKLQTEKTGVFTEVKAGEALPKGFADLTIKANIKTHLEGYYMGESNNSLHGKSAYPFVINIDGQAAAWYAEGARDSKPEYGKDGRTSRDPEAGEGIKYAIEKRIRLSAGNHRVFLGLPEEDYFVEVEIILKEGESSVLEFKPLYRTKRIPTRIPTFLKGIEKYEVYLNEVPCPRPDA